VCFVKNGYWIISDRLECPGEHAYSQLFHFRPDRSVKAVGPGRAGTVDPGRANVLLVQADAAPDAQGSGGRDDPPQGWFSPAGGKIVPAPAGSVAQKTPDDAVYDTVLLPLAAGRTAEIRVERIACADESGRAIPARDVCALRIVMPSGTDYYVNDLRQREIGPPCARIKRAGNLETDARAAIVRLDRQDRVMAASVTGGSLLRHRGQSALAAPSRP